MMTVDWLFRCGGCGLKCQTLWELHLHLHDHTSTGSYIYNHDIRTGYPRYNTVCCETQTLEEELSTEPNFKPVLLSSFTQTEADLVGYLPSTENQEIIDEHYTSDIQYDIFPVVKVEKTNCDQDFSDQEINEKKKTCKRKRKPKQIVKKETKQNVKTYLEKKIGAKRKNIRKLRSKQPIKKRKKVVYDDDSDTNSWFSDNESSENFTNILNKYQETNQTSEEKSDNVLTESFQSDDDEQNTKMKKKFSDHENSKLKSSNRKLSRKKSRVNKNTKLPQCVECKYCDQTFANRRKQKLHMIENHPEEKKFDCKSCTECFVTEKELERHRRDHRKEQHQCTVCFKFLASSQTLANHMTFHTGVKLHKCSVCDAEFRTSSQRALHMKRLHNDSYDHMCENCGKLFKCRENLRGHVHYCLEIKPFKCDICDKTFPRNSVLRVHMRSHTGEKPFICEQCGMKFGHCSSLIKHARVHSGERPFECNVCQQTFKAHNSLKDHMRIHLQDKRFSCQYCNKTFVKKCNMVTHTRQHTGETPFSCHLCGQGYKQRVLLKTHMQQQHRNELSPEEMLKYESSTMSKFDLTNTGDKSNSKKLSRKVSPFIKEGNLYNNTESGNYEQSSGNYEQSSGNYEQLSGHVNNISFSKTFSALISGKTDDVMHQNNMLSSHHPGTDQGLQHVGKTIPSMDIGHPGMPMECSNMDLISTGHVHLHQMGL